MGGGQDESRHLRREGGRGEGRMRGGKVEGQGVEVGERRGGGGGRSSGL